MYSYYNYYNYYCVLVTVGSYWLVGGGAAAGAPQLVTVGGEGEKHGAGEEQQEQEQPLAGSTAQGEQGDAAVPGGRQAGERDPSGRTEEAKTTNQIESNVTQYIWCIKRLSKPGSQGAVQSTQWEKNWYEIKVKNGK